jgi:isobutyryl-CoA mutase
MTSRPSSSQSSEVAPLEGRYQCRNKIRIVTATSLFDGHDAAINVMRRILQATGAEIIHLGHNRSVDDIVTAALQEDAHAIAVSSYQGGHIEFFKYMIDMLRRKGASHIKVFAGGGGVIAPHEIRTLEAYGVARIYSPEDGQKFGLQGMINDICEKSDYEITSIGGLDLEAAKGGDMQAISHLLSCLENEAVPAEMLQSIRNEAKTAKVPVFGITGTGGAGKSSLTDEVIRRFRIDQGDTLKIAVLAIDPSRRRSGGALLGDRIRMNAIDHENIFMRSIATRDAQTEIPAGLADMVALTRCSGFDLVIVETPGIGQGNAALLPLVDLSLYVMTPEFGAATQLEKIDMLDFADVIAINKFDRRGAEDALRDVRKQVQRNHEEFSKAPEDFPVFGTIASRYNDDGVTALYHGLKDVLAERGLMTFSGEALPRMETKIPSGTSVIVPPERRRYLAEISETVRGYHAQSAKQVIIARERQHLTEAQKMLQDKGAQVEDLDPLIEERTNALDAQSKKLIEEWPAVKSAYEGEVYVTKVRGQEIKTDLLTKTLSGNLIRKIAVPQYEDQGEILKWRLRENLPGEFPFTAGVFRFKREGEDPARMFAGEGDAAQTNARFKVLSAHSEAKRLSTAFDSVTLYGADPAIRPDIYGKVGNSGVSISTLDDMKTLYDGFDLCSPMNSVSMTINGPAPTILAFFLNTAIDTSVEDMEKEKGRSLTRDEFAQVKDNVLQNVRGTVQADILKEDQGQNTCLFSTEFSLKMMGDIAEYFVDYKVRNFYSVSISGYHIAEAGANPISQLAFTLANGFTYVESYLTRGLRVDDFAPNLSFFFSNGMDPEYTVLGRVARRIWATAMRDKYGADERSQKLKYHIQTSGRSLHAQEMDFNDIRTTLQALIATYDHCNSLHTNAYDEAVTTPTEASVRRALAIQMIINREWGLARNENPNQGSFIIDELTDLVEEAVLQEFDRISDRGGVLGAMETGYQRGRIQDESIDYEHKKHDGSLPIIGVNTFLSTAPDDGEEKIIELARSSEQVKQSQLDRLEAFHERNKDAAGPALAALKRSVLENKNVFEVLMETARVCSLGQITDAFFEVGGQYRRNM